MKRSDVFSSQWASDTGMYMRWKGCDQDVSAKITCGGKVGVRKGKVCSWNALLDKV